MYNNIVSLEFRSARKFSYRENRAISLFLSLSFYLCNLRENWRAKFSFPLRSVLWTRSPLFAKRETGLTGRAGAPEARVNRRAFYTPFVRGDELRARSPRSRTSRVLRLYTPRFISREADETLAARSRPRCERRKLRSTRSDPPFRRLAPLPSRGEARIFTVSRGPGDRSTRARDDDDFSPYIGGIPPQVYERYIARRFWEYRIRFRRGTALLAVSLAALSDRGERAVYVFSLAFTTALLF